MAAEPFVYHRQGRSRATIGVVLAVWIAAILAILLVQASPWLMAALVLFTLPALWEVWANPSAGLRMDRDGIHWFTGKRAATLKWTEVDHMRLDTRIDLSVRISAVLLSGRKLRLPYEATPPHKAFEAALHHLGVRTERHHFSWIG
ncbi:hypothetical protein So717_03280 [Roseobacter cerasinus]|uniref:PH domain-containing protein n=1 Tax=Roseobacter cerasinus TaxID=2602289 RepID=A0A640VNY3_9RHOB|nr:hypothetical protein [Roseobacter cerasinus]GFE48575.1 hypothetical protein So717_03280 [Roseobacter cerasinus]